MKRKLMTMALSLLAMSNALLAVAGAPDGYYTQLNGLKDQALKDAVHNLIAPHTVVSYSSLWRYFPQTDCRDNNRNQVWDMYSNQTYYFNGTRGVAGMEKEHSFPKSWWGGSTGVDAYTDLNHLYPSNGPANRAKLNWPLGEVSTPSFDNGVTKVGVPVAGEGGGAGTVFEPDNQYKGDFARTYFYMATCYQQYQWQHTYMVTNSTWKTLNDWSIALLLKWSHQDPVSDKEKKRNDAVYAVQGNRNPFIDNPELADYIWGNKAGQVFNTGGGTINPDDPNATPELISPKQGNIFDIGEVAIGKSTSHTIYIKTRNLTNDLSVDLINFDHEMFSLNVSQVDRQMANSANGYPLVVTFAPTSLGVKQAKLLISDGGLVGSYGVMLNARCLPQPTLSTITATPAQEITDSSYVATWEATTDTIDCYLLNRIVYDSRHNIVANETFTIDADETQHRFNDLKAGYSHTYSVQSSRLGCTSTASNVITIDPSGIESLPADKPLALIAIDGGVIVKCSENLGTARIFNTSGMLVKEIDNLTNDMTIELPTGIYIMTTSTSIKAVKLAIK